MSFAIESVVYERKLMSFEIIRDPHRDRIETLFCPDLMFGISLGLANSGTLHPFSGRMTQHPYFKQVRVRKP